VELTNFFVQIKVFGILRDNLVKKLLNEQILISIQLAVHINFFAHLSASQMLEKRFRSNHISIHLNVTLHG